MTIEEVMRRGTPQKLKRSKTHRANQNKIKIIHSLWLYTIPSVGICFHKFINLSKSFSKHYLYVLLYDAITMYPCIIDFPSINEQKIPLIQNVFQYDEPSTQNSRESIITYTP